MWREKAMINWMATVRLMYDVDSLRIAVACEESTNGAAEAVC